MRILLTSICFIFLVTTSHASVDCAYLKKTITIHINVSKAINDMAIKEKNAEANDVLIAGYLRETRAASDLSNVYETFCKD